MVCRSEIESCCSFRPWSGYAVPDVEILTIGGWRLLAFFLSRTSARPSVCGWPAK